jgi:hypothetical protein
MSGERRLQSGQACLQEPERPLDSAREPHQFGGWPLTRELPLLMTPADLRTVFQISESCYFRLKALGRFTRFEAEPVLDTVRYSGALVRAFLLHEGRGARTFGAKRGPRTMQVSRVTNHAAQSSASAGHRASECISPKGCA